MKREEEWKEAKKRCRLSQEDLRMARELGMGPRSLIKNIPSPSQRWKAPVKVWIRDLYAKKFGKTLQPPRPATSWSIHPPAITPEEVELDFIRELYESAPPVRDEAMDEDERMLRRQRASDEEDDTVPF